MKKKIGLLVAMLVLSHIVFAQDCNLDKYGMGIKRLIKDDDGEAMLARCYNLSGSELKKYLNRSWDMTYFTFLEREWWTEEAEHGDISSLPPSLRNLVQEYDVICTPLKVYNDLAEGNTEPRDCYKEMYIIVVDRKKGKALVSLGTIYEGTGCGIHL